MTEPLTCKCGVQTFTQIHCIEPGLLGMRCYHCGQSFTVNVAVLAAESAWRRMEREAPEPAKPSGYKYGGLL